MTRADRKKQIRSLAAKTGKRSRGAANILNREQNARERAAARPAEIPRDVVVPAVAKITPVIARRGRALPTFRHFHLGEPTKYEVDVFAVNQTVAFFIGKFTTGWSSSDYRLDPVYQRATWAQEREATEDELRALAERAIQNVHSEGYVLVVHAPGRLALMWSDHPLPRDGNERIVEMFGPSMRTLPRQAITEGPPPAWWPRQSAQDGETDMRLSMSVEGDHRWAHAAVAYALKKGILVRPDTCEACKRKPARTSVRSTRRKVHSKSGIQAHHPDYKHLLRVEWLCGNCHDALNPHVKNTHGMQGERSLYVALREEHGDPIRGGLHGDDDGEELEDEGAESLAEMFADQYGGFEGDGLS